LVLLPPFCLQLAVLPSMCIFPSLSPGTLYLLPCLLHSITPPIRPLCQSPNPLCTYIIQPFPALAYSF
jgi:hypothetical protein